MLDVRRLSQRQFWRRAWAWWKHGVIVLVMFFVGLMAAVTATAILWLGLNIIPMLAFEAWTFAEVMEWFGWTWPIWLPFAFGFATRHLPPAPDELSGPPG